MRRPRYALILLLVALAQVAWSQTPASTQSTNKTPTDTVENAPPNKQVEDCKCESQVLPDALAIVNGIRITRHDVERATREPVKTLQNDFVEVRKRELTIQINSKLLAIEARRRGINTTQLLQEEVVAKVKQPTEVEVRTFYDQNKARIEGDFSSRRDAVIEYIRNQRQQEEAQRYADRLRKTIETKIVSSETTPGSEVQRDRVLAVVNGESITYGHIEDSLRLLLFDTQQRVYELRKTELDLNINDTLLQQEAQRRKITTKALLETEVQPKAVGEEDARKFYEQNQSRVSGDFTQTKDGIIQYLQQVELRKAERAFVEKMRGSASIQVFLLPPEVPVFSISTDNQPSLGNPQAPVTIVEFTDYQCPSCAASQPILERLVKEYGDKVRLVIRDFPLTQHKEAFKAAEAAEAARQQGKYWEYAQTLMRNQSALNVEKLKQYANELALDMARFDRALQSGTFEETVRFDIEEGIRLGVNSTPAIFVNGRRVFDHSNDGLQAAIEAALKPQQAKPSGAEGSRK
jgi:protein-disulfide isomerase